MATYTRTQIFKCGKCGHLFTQLEQGIINCPECGQTHSLEIVGFTTKIEVTK